jgi:hypothetical protein
MVKLINEATDGAIANLIDAPEAMSSTLYPTRHNVRQRAMEV